MRARPTIPSLLAATFALCGTLCLASGAEAQTHDASFSPDARVTPLTRVVTPSPMRPPEPRIVSRGPIPYPHAVWVAGYWDWTGREYVWRDGRWTAPQPGMHWRDTRWQPYGDGWIRVPGRWVR